MSGPPTPLSMERGGKKSTAIPEEEKADEPSLPPMTPESKQLAAVVATAVVAAAMAGKSASPDSSSSMVRYSAGVSLASRTRSIISIVRNLKLHLVTLPGATWLACLWIPRKAGMPPRRLTTWTWCSVPIRVHTLPDLEAHRTSMSPCRPPWTHLPPGWSAGLACCAAAVGLLG